MHDTLKRFRQLQQARGFMYVAGRSNAQHDEEFMKLANKINAYRAKYPNVPELKWAFD